jgi:hypothetical protein
MRNMLTVWLLLNAIIPFMLCEPSDAQAQFGTCPAPPTCVMDCREVGGIYGRTASGTVICTWYSEPQGRTPYAPGPPQPGSLQPTNDDIVRFTDTFQCQSTCGSAACFPTEASNFMTPNAADISKKVCETDG